MPNRKQRQQNAANHHDLMRKIGPLRTCPNCLIEHRDAGHFAPPSLGEEGFFICKKPDRSTFVHVDDYLDSENADPIAKEFLEHARRSAMEKDHAWLKQNSPNVTWKGAQYVCVGASRMGDVWLRNQREPIGSVFYDHRVNVADLSKWSRP